MSGEKDPKQILRVDGKTQFLEVMANCLNIDKVYINFEEYDETKPQGQRKKAQVQFYLDTFECYVLAKDIFSGKISALGKQSLDTATKGGYKYAKEVFAKLGGVSAAKLAKKGESRSDGMSISRQFKLTPGQKMAWVISAETGPGEEDSNGLIVPKYKKPEQIIRIAMTDQQLKIFASALELLVQRWMSEKDFTSPNKA